MPANKPIIAILLGAPFTAQNYERTGIPYLKEDFEVVVLDCNPWLRPGYDGLVFSKHEYSAIETISCSDEFMEAAGRINAAYAIDFIGFDPSMRLITKTLRAHGTRFVVQKTGTLPTLSAREKRQALISMAVKNPFRLFSVPLARLSRKSKELLDIAPDVALLAGRNSLDPYTRKAKEIVWISSNDYHTYKRAQDRLARQESSLPFQGRYTLLIDDCMALATDYALLRQAPPVEADDYFSLLRDAMDKVEHISGVPVVVAGHPNGKDREGYVSLFGERKIYFDITAELCAQSDLVLAHDSTALSFAALWRKPLVVLTSGGLDRSNRGPNLRERSDRFKCPLLFMDGSVAEFESAIQRSSEVDADAYRRYVEDFITTGEVDEDGPWRGFISFVKANT